MPLFRATFFFKNSNGYGWTETIHSNKATLTDVLNAAAALVPIRQKLMGNDVFLPFVRVSDDLVRGDSFIFQVPGGSTGNATHNAQTSDIPNTCLVIRLDASSTRRRTLYLRGQPDTVVQSGGVYTPDGPFITNMDRWLQQLIDDTWAIKGKSGTALPIPISTATQTLPDGVVTVTTPTPHGLSVRDTVTIQRCVGSPQINGTWQVNKVDSAEVFKILIKQIMGNYLGAGTATASAFNALPIIEGEVRGVSHRITGVPFDRPRGRRPVKV